ncbi:type I-C CRISPR-associated endonuclease Cas1c [Rhodospirillum rubrum]|uniref:CRISPR-associated endonuclease Cas1 2 n=1 Tax=Rhodospirillum rubrum (strain ATCC 11170 / ATH 1.1.1 / DSM 467 / LMG 4362 / NCIMB 8255 / S1) TaxID=269796 RepID=CAS1B_RHORT|nr:type I-C CRISPR-associated endonuclease Cas1c [Rhodospirillum rubrum]Q2RW61.1 RecName: Full=CRISPR-associated endonuclease Cas1 2 [Rhodospirillum rubrum ATCC 11170]ABC21634.1 CRISPR-associated protein, Cas1 family [Rhodospirillum rubrum ATCC 11170]AEO47329.1 CRISPR-associated protein Cas1 [Rhodospirillum rubrum F11]QXG81301.1 type I-C CRISPR-associated endonuclease Cas1c [Rhodospirillum rubrum]HAQ00926.1 subtype I-C CRISPR-associated endonuclease Cas1 [Rhodospirillum rubrum]
MKKLLNTVYVTTEGTGLRKDGENLVAELDGVQKGRVPLHMVGSVVVFGGTYVSPGLMGACAAHGITIVLLDRVGRFQARVEGPVAGNVLLRRAQYKASEAPEDIVKSLILGKVSNQRAVLLRALRDHGADFPAAEALAVKDAIDRMAHILRKVGASAEDADHLRGAEGEAASLYFGVFGQLIRSPDGDFAFRGRSRRPPLDPTNALLSFLYTLLTHDCRSACESVGLDPAVGFLHRDRPGRPSLALDLMEELRPVLVDRLALSLINRRQLRATDFQRLDGGAVLLTDEARKTVLSAWQERKKQERRHPFLEESAPLGLVPYLQAQMLARHLRGDLDAYPPWFWK